MSNELEWLNQLFVAGGLADLELGPFARNIMGGKESAERISKAYKRLNKKILNKHPDKIVNSTQSYRGVLLQLLNRFNSNRPTHDTD